MTKTSIIAAFVAGIILLAAPPGLAQPLVGVDGVAEVGTIDPWSVWDADASDQYGGSGTSGGESDSARCLIPGFGGGCLLEMQEHEEFETVDENDAHWYYYDATNSTMSGYYVDVLDGVVFMRASSGAVEEGSGAGSSGQSEDYARTLYENSLGYSEEHEDGEWLAWDDDERSASRVDQLLVEGGADAPVAHADLTLDRQANGESSESASSEGSGSNMTRDEYFGVPIYEEEDAQSHLFESEAERFWNRTVLGGAVYLVNPTDGSRVDIVGLTMDRGDEAGAGEAEQESASSESTSVFGFTVFEHSESDAGESEYAFFREWLHLSADLVSGQVTGGATYDHGEESDESWSDTQDETNVAGVPVYGEDHSVTGEGEREWRDVAFALDAGQGAGVVSLGAWDDSSSSREAYSDTYSIVGIPVGVEGESASTFHSDGVGLGLDLGGGALLLNARYENRSSSESNQDDITLGGSPLAGIGADDERASRGVYVDAGSQLVPVSLGAHHENSSSYEADWIRLAGDDFAGLSQQDEHTEYGGDAAVGDVFVFSLLYSDGRSDDAIHLAGVPLGVRDDYRSLDASLGGDAAAPTGQHLFSYSFEHEESSHDYDLYADDSTVGGLRHNTTADRVSVIVLDGQAGAHAEREFSNDQVFAGDDTEIAELGIQRVDAGVDHGGADAAGVGDGGASTSVFLTYVEAADAIAIMAGLATWCVDPGVPLPYDTLLGAVPGEARPAAATALGAAALLMCFGAPILAPIFLASPCIVVPLAVGTVMLTSGVATSLLPVGSEVDGVLATGEGAFYDVYDEHVGCVWLTIPDAARNPQPAIGALALVTETTDGALAQAWPAYDDARLTAWELVDMVFGADHDVGNPTIPAPPAVPAG